MPSIGQLLALVDSLQTGTLNDAQRKMVHALRVGILALAERMVESLGESATKAGDGGSAADSV